MTRVEPIGGLRYVVDNHESNEGWLEHNGESGRRWVAKIRWNGEPLEAKQTATGKAFAEGPAMLEWLHECLPISICASDPLASDDAVVSLGITMRNLRRISGIMSDATHRIEDAS